MTHPHLSHTEAPHPQLHKHPIPTLHEHTHPTLTTTDMVTPSHSPLLTWSPPHPHHHHHAPPPPPHPTYMGPPPHSPLLTWSPPPPHLPLPSGPHHGLPLFQARDRAAPVPTLHPRALESGWSAEGAGLLPEVSSGSTRGNSTKGVRPTIPGRRSILCSLSLPWLFTMLHHSPRPTLLN